jgi:hypothetical protein
MDDEIQNAASDEPDFAILVNSRERFVRHGIPSEIRIYYAKRAQSLRAQAIRAFLFRLGRLLWPKRQPEAKSTATERDLWSKAYDLQGLDERQLRDIGLTRVKAEG